jgi:hypothetical protein
MTDFGSSSRQCDVYSFGSFSIMKQLGWCWNWLPLIIAP